MRKFSLEATAREQLRAAAGADAHGRSAETIFGGHEHALRQTVLAMTAGTEHAEHQGPGEATVVVLTGRIRVRADNVNWDGRRGDLIVLPVTRHSVEALEDSAFLLTVVKDGIPPSTH